jgi:biopolymer transport protein ExbD
MAMTTATAQGDIMVEVNTTPLIDVMLVLLTLLVITLPIQTHAVKLDVPTSAPVTIIPPSVELGVDFDGRITWNGAPVTRATMDSYFAAIARKPVDAQEDIHLRADRLARYNAVAMVLADAQRLGATHIGFAGLAP